MGYYKMKNLSFLEWAKEIYGITPPLEMEQYIKNLRNLKPTKTIIQTPRGYYIRKNYTPCNEGGMHHGRKC